ncbi:MULTISPECIES: ATP-binding protein [unclassified Xanthobacter]|uniref:ATP-binding protein n=1 Tax=unclassified Xanthobacter TaxID=2623496 RepID=UPI001EDD078F|nr:MULTISPECIES: ATP-binding protein [unclassified Xanthobacter]
MLRFGIGARIALITLVALVAAQVLMLAAYMMERRRADAASATFLPLMGQIAAVVRLVDQIDPAQRDLALQATTSAGFLPRYLKTPPAIHTPLLLQTVERRLRALIGADDGWLIAVTIIGSDRNGGQPVRRLGELSGARLQAVVALRSGGYLEILAGGDLTVRLLGLPVGLLAGVLGFLVALAALLAVHREMRPLTALVAAVNRFGAALEVQPVPERGAPDVRAVIRAVNVMQARIADLVRTRTLVLGAISHDLRTYLTRLRLRLELLPADPHVAKANADLDGMQALVDDALAYARATFSGASDEVVDLSVLARAELEARQTQQAKVRGAEVQGAKVQGADGAAEPRLAPVRLTGADTPHLVRGAPGALARVVANLVGNALAYGGCADISLFTGRDTVELRVEDRGPGIPPAARELVFEPFQRLEPSRNRDSGGAGLGLTIVRQIVAGHGGQVIIADRPGGGAQVRVLLPALALGEGPA